MPPWDWKVEKEECLHNDAYKGIYLLMVVLILRIFSFKSSFHSSSSTGQSSVPLRIACCVDTLDWGREETAGNSPSLATLYAGACACGGGKQPDLEEICLI